MSTLLPNTCRLNRGALGGSKEGRKPELQQSGLNFTPLERGLLPCSWFFSARTYQEQQILLDRILEQPWDCSDLCWLPVESIEEPGMG